MFLEYLLSIRHDLMVLHRWHLPELLSRLEQTEVVQQSENCIVEFMNTWINLHYRSVLKFNVIVSKCLTGFCTIPLISLILQKPDNDNIQTNNPLDQRLFLSIYPTLMLSNNDNKIIKLLKINWHSWEEHLLSPSLKGDFCSDLLKKMIVDRLTLLMKWNEEKKCSTFCLAQKSSKTIPWLIFVHFLNGYCSAYQLKIYASHLHKILSACPWGPST